MTIEERKKVTPLTMKIVYGKAAGRCSICAKDTSYGSYDDLRRIGELAHIVGATRGANSPRSDSDLSLDQRADEDNIMLLCQDCHTEIDTSEEDWSIERLTQIKEDHETRVRLSTDFQNYQSTLTLKMVGSLKGRETVVHPDRIKEALIQENLTVAPLKGSINGISIEITDKDFEASRQEIDDEIKHWHRIINKDSFSSTSVFAMAPIPLLVYLGYRLGNLSKVKLFPFFDGNWIWPSKNTRVDFCVDAPGQNHSVQEIAVIMHISAETNTSDLPDFVNELPIYEIRPSGVAIPSRNLIDSETALADFAECWRALLNRVAKNHSGATRMHIFGAVPITAAIAIGQHYAVGTSPILALYDKNNNSYTKAIEIPHND